MFVLDSKIKIGKYTFTRVYDVKIIKSVDLLSDTAIIKMPLSAMFGNNEQGFEKKKLETEIKTGDEVEIILSYKDVISNVEFKGFVSAIHPNSPIITIECEDLIYKLRQKGINKNFGKTTLKEVLKYIINDTGIKLSNYTGDIPFNNYLIKDKNGAQALQQIKEKYLQTVFIDDDNKLFVGLRQQMNALQTVNYSLNQNIVKHKLKFQRKEDVKICVSVIGVRKDNTKETVLIGDLSGEKRTIHLQTVTDVETLKKLANEELKRLVYDGYKGTITSFLQPFATRGMTANIIDKNYPERQGKYFITKVTVTFGQNGARRIIELSNKIS